MKIATLKKETKPFFVFVPTYLEGGNGIDSGDQEILTETMREYFGISRKSCALSWCCR